MLHIHQVLAFSIAALLIVLVPGPNMTFLISCAINYGKRPAIIALLGSNAALLVLAIITGMGLNTLLKAVPIAYDILKVAGAIYLFWLAWKNIRKEPKVIDDKVIKGITGYNNVFQKGFLTNLLNPKTAAFYLAIFPEFLNSKADYIVLQGALLGLVHAIVSFGVNILIIGFAWQITQRFTAGKKLLAVRKWLTAILFTAFGIRMLLQKAVS